MGTFYAVIRYNNGHKSELTFNDKRSAIALVIASKGAANMKSADVYTHDNRSVFSVTK